MMVSAGANAKPVRVPMTKKITGGFYSVSEHVYKADRIYHDMVKTSLRSQASIYPELM
jgi:hypothetical protein